MDLESCGADGLDALYRRHQPMVYRYCLSIMRSPEEADDVAQSTWMQAMVALSAPDIVVRNVPSWLRTIARNECFDVLRGRGALQPLDVSTLEVSSGTTPDDVYETREQLGFLVADLQELSERQRSAIVLREICGLSSEQLADALETTSERASGLVADARQTLSRRRSGRDLSCPDVRRQLRQGRQRSSGLRAHLEVCGPCQGVERRRRGRALSSLALLPWSLLRSLFERCEAAIAAPAAVKSAVAGVLIVGSLTTSLPIVVPESPPRSGASQPTGKASAAARPVHAGPDARVSQRRTRRDTRQRAATHAARDEPRETSPAGDSSAAPTPAPTADPPATPAPQAPAAEREERPTSIRETTAAVERTVRETVAATERTVQETTAALAQTAGQSTATVDGALRQTAEATDRALKGIVAAQPLPLR